MPLSFDEFVFDSEARQLWRRDEEIHLPPRAFRLLEVLLDARPKVLSKAELFERVWPDVLVDESNLKTVVSDLRAALGDTSKPPRYIRTVHGHGYAFCAGVRTVRPVRQAVVYQIQSASERFILADGANTIGRHPDCTVWLDSVEVSREHARLTIRSGGAILEDLQSKNGTWLDGKRITGPVELSDGTRFELGNLSLIFRIHRPEESTRSAREREVENL